MGMRQSMSCRSHVAAIAEIKLLNVEILGSHAFFLSQSQINTFIPCNFHIKLVLSVLCVLFDSTILLLFLHKKCVQFLCTEFFFFFFVAGLEYDSHVLG